MSSGSTPDPAGRRRAWNDLLQLQAAPTPFMRHEYLLALHASGSAVPATGWAPRLAHAGARRQLQAACALYLKSHSYGEYVFDWAWADAYRRHGLPTTPSCWAPCPSRRCPARGCWPRDAAGDSACWAGAGRTGTSTGAVVGPRAVCRRTDRVACSAPAGCCAKACSSTGRRTPRNPWCRLRRPAGQRCSATSARRSSRSAAAWPRPASASPCTTARRSTSRAVGLLPPLLHAHLPGAPQHALPDARLLRAHGAQTMPQHWVMFVARGRAAGRGSLVAVDPGARQPPGAATGAATEPVPCLHFEACYYQPLAWCIATATVRFEGGAQGEHKMARGLLPVSTGRRTGCATRALPLPSRLPGRRRPGHRAVRGRTARAQPVQRRLIRQDQAALRPCRRHATDDFGTRASGLPSPAP
jgi:hypothetical protein